MNIFWAFWIPANIMFWFWCASEARNPTKIHFVASFFFSMITGALPMLIYKLL